MSMIPNYGNLIAFFHCFFFLLLIFLLRHFMLMSDRYWLRECSHNCRYYSNCVTFLFFLVWSHSISFAHNYSSFHFLRWCARPSFFLSTFFCFVNLSSLCIRVRSACHAMAGHWFAWLYRCTGFHLQFSHENSFYILPTGYKLPFFVSSYFLFLLQKNRNCFIAYCCWHYFRSSLAWREQKRWQWLKLQKQ